jgi:hypothetical protein
MDDRTDALPIAKALKRVVDLVEFVMMRHKLVEGNFLVQVLLNKF